VAGGRARHQYQVHIVDLVGEGPAEDLQLHGALGTLPLHLFVYRLVYILVCMLVYVSIHVTVC
jgi:hypothetical protein